MDCEPSGRNPDYDGSPEAEARRMRSSRDRARRERDELQARVVELERLSLRVTTEEKRLRKALRMILTSDDCYQLKMEHRGWFKWDKIDGGRWYWWWDEDPDGAPVPVSVMHSPTTQKYFASTGQLGWNRAQDVDSMGGWWMKLVEPSVADHPGW